MEKNLENLTSKILLSKTSFLWLACCHKIAGKWKNINEKKNKQPQIPFFIFYINFNNILHVQLFLLVSYGWFLWLEGV